MATMNQKDCKYLYDEIDRVIHKKGCCGICKNHQFTKSKYLKRAANEGYSICICCVNDYKAYVMKRADSDYLLKNLQVLPFSESNNKKPVIDCFRHRNLSDETIRFAEESGVIHDKKCSVIRNMPDEKITWLSTFNPQLKACPQCAKNAYVKAYADDPENIQRYIRFFDKVHATSNDINCMYISLGLKTEMIGNSLKLKSEDGIWKIEPIGASGDVRLFHNNYYVTNTEVIQRPGKYHIQDASTKNCTFRHAIQTAAKHRNFYKHQMVIQVVQTDLTWKEIAMIVIKKLQAIFLRDK